jgi:hypothetical protein
MSRLATRLAAALTLIVASASVAIAAPDQQSSTGEAADDRGTPRVVASGGTRTWVFSTRDRQFRPHTSNQGWWSNTHRAEDSNDNYLVGRCCGGGEYRNFFTFHLGELAGDVVSATLVVRKYNGRGDPYERFRLVEVSTAARKLNDNRGRNLEVFRDLGRGERYGTFRVSTKDEANRDDVFSLDLNDQAERSIERAAGGFFSVGGRLVSLRHGGFLFADSGGRGRQELIVTTRP